MMTMVSPQPSAGSRLVGDCDWLPREDHGGWRGTFSTALILLAAPSLLALVGTHVCVFLDEDGGEEKTVREEEVNSRVKK